MAGLIWTIAAHKEQYFIDLYPPIVFTALIFTNVRGIGWILLRIAAMLGLPYCCYGRFEYVRVHPETLAVTIGLTLAGFLIALAWLVWSRTPLYHLYCSSVFALRRPPNPDAAATA